MEEIYGPYGNMGQGTQRISTIWGGKMHYCLVSQWISILCSRPMKKGMVPQRCQCQALCKGWRRISDDCGFCLDRFWLACFTWWKEISMTNLWTRKESWWLFFKWRHHCTGRRSNWHSQGILPWVWPCSYLQQCDYSPKACWGCSICLKDAERHSETWNKLGNWSLKTQSNYRKDCLPTWWINQENQDLDEGWAVQQWWSPTTVFLSGSPRQKSMGKIQGDGSDSAGERIWGHVKSARIMQKV